MPYSKQARASSPCLSPQKSDGGTYEVTTQASPSVSCLASHCDTAGIPADCIPNCWIDLHRNQPACNGILPRLRCRVDRQRSQRHDLPDGGPWHLLRLCSTYRGMAAGEGNRPHAWSSGFSVSLIIKFSCSPFSGTRQNRTVNLPVEHRTPCGNARTSSWDSSHRSV